MEARFSKGVELRDSKETRRALRRDWGGIALSAEEEILRKNLTSHQFPERARTHQLRGISTVSHFLNVGQMCRDVRRRTVEGVDPETWYGRVVTSVGRLEEEGAEKRKGKEGDAGRWSIAGRGRRRETGSSGTAKSAGNGHGGGVQDFSMDSNKLHLPRKKGASDLEAYQIVIVGNRRLIYHGNAPYPSLKAPTSLFLETRGFAV
ncbi:hypothetical protein ALC53_08945 [Atta colombica]|uniref:Uncharacterized protein n=1 Tax=Atta colombica TaxID=520822 RepID=A0A151I236_9HYME|nr:hypothetical protein ALC53_08945 [Atta colombica]